jgi:hypothetical protein
VRTEEKQKDRQVKPVGFQKNMSGTFYFSR